MAGLRDTHHRGDGEAPRGATRSEVSGSAGDVVQARDVSGGVHFHGSGREPVPVPAQLPAEIRGFVNRVADLERMDAVLGESVRQPGSAAVCVIAGTAGVGKTSLAVHWAHRHAARFPDGQLFVDLRGFDPSGQPMASGEAVRAFLDALGVDPRSLPVELAAQIGRYRSLVADRGMLIVLDNARDAAQVAPLLPGSRTCAVLITSRDRMDGLAVTHDVRQLAVGFLEDPDARALLDRRLGHARVDAEPEAVAELLGCCAGLPLALSILAGRASTQPDFPLAVLAAQLRDAATRVGVLDTGDARTTVQAVLSWSYHALTARQARVFALLGMAPGPDISLPAAVSLTDLPVSQVQTVLRALTRVSLADERAPGRYRTHDLTRLYATQQAGRDQPEQALVAALRRLVDFYLHTAHAGERLLNPHSDLDRIELEAPVAGCDPYPLAEQAAAWAWFDAEHPNLIAAQQLAAEQGWHGAVWQLAWVLSIFHIRRGLWRDFLSVWQAGLAAAGHLSDPLALIRAYGSLGYGYAAVGRHTEALDHLRQTLELAERAGDLRSQAITHWAFAMAWGGRGEDQQALEHARQAVDLYRAVQDPVGEIEALNGVGWYATRLGHYDQARQHLEAALDLCRGHPHPAGEAQALESLGYLAHHTGHRAQALDHYREALTLYRENGYTYAEADTLDRLGHTHLALREHDQARHAWQQALELYRSQHRDGDADRVRQQLGTLDEHPDATER